MQHLPFCPNPRCRLHSIATESGWAVSAGSHHTKAFGVVPRFRCTSCGCTFSSQTFSLDYYAKRRLPYQDVLSRHRGSESLRAIGRSFGASCATVQNRLDRLSRQAIALHALLAPHISASENICIDGFVSFDRSQFFPNEITIAITSESRFVLSLSHATKRRSGSMTPCQKTKAASLYSQLHVEPRAVQRTFSDVVSQVAHLCPPRSHHPLVLVTDEKKEYYQALHRLPVWVDQDTDHRIAQITVSSQLPRTFRNPLFASNYLDREIRKDQANHHRESTCFTRNVANGMNRLALYLFDHNYRKRFSIKAPPRDCRTHALVAGIDPELIRTGLLHFFTLRAFRSRVDLPPLLDRIWMKQYRTPLKSSPDYLPAFAAA